VVVGLRRRQTFEAESELKIHLCNPTTYYYS
jgi:hypothetical protein